MISAELLAWVAVGFGIATALVLAVWLAHAAWQVRSLARYEATRPAVLRTVAAALGGDSSAEAELALTRLPEGRRIDVLVDMAFTVAGDQRRELNHLAERVGIREQATRWSWSRRPSRRLRAARLLALFGAADERDGLLLLADPRPEVRAEAAQWAVAHPAPAALERLVEMLDDSDPGVRFAAVDALRRTGPRAVGPLARRLADAEGPAARGGLEAASGVAAPELLTGALRLLGDQDPQTRARAAALAAAIGGPEAAERLLAALGDPSAPVRAEAARGLGALGHWRAAAPLAALLADEAFAVRRAAATALRRLGPTGELLLKRAARSPESPAAVRDMALNSLGAEPGEAPSEASSPPPSGIAPKEVAA